MNRNFLSLLAASRTRSSPFGLLSRLCVRSRLARFVRVFLGQRPSLHNLRWRSPAFVRLFRRYYSAVRLPAAVHVGLIAHRLLPPVHGVSTPDSDRASRFSRMEFLCVRRVFDSAGPQGTRAIAPCVIAFRKRGHRPLPDSQISELKIPPAYSPVQRFECSLTTALAWLGARLVRYSFSCVNFPFTAPRRFIPTLSLLGCSPTIRGLCREAPP